MFDKTEQEIMKNWKGDITQPVVSVCCITYNHEKYIAEAIDSFLMQETDFPFEIVIGEDCSTDDTRKVIEEYIKKYPKIVKLIKSEYNVGMNVNFQRTIKVCKGNFIALCEGDDYWTNPKKLQIQIDEMKKNPDVDISFHPAYELIDNKKGKILSQHSNTNKVFTTSEVIQGDGGFMPTASLILKKEVVLDFPNWFYKDAPVGDFFIQIFASIKGGSLYISIPMSIYRTSHTGSWSESIKDENKKILFVEKMQKVMKLLDKQLEYRYSKEIEKYIKKYIWGIILNRHINISSKKAFFYKNKNSFSIRQKILWYTVFSNYNIDRILRFFYDKIRGK
jgi:glycosyltransferase involved in cell wall biosynthesis